MTTHDPVTQAETHLNLLNTVRGSLTAVLPAPGYDLVTIGNSSELHRITELVARAGWDGNRMVANLHSIGTKQPNIHVELHELRHVA